VTVERLRIERLGIISGACSMAESAGWSVPRSGRFTRCGSVLEWRWMARGPMGAGSPGAVGPGVPLSTPRGECRLFVIEGDGVAWQAWLVMFEAMDGSGRIDSELHYCAHDAAVEAALRRCKGARVTITPGASRAARRAAEEAVGVRWWEHGCPRGGDER